MDLAGYYRAAVGEACREDYYGGLAMSKRYFCDSEWA